MYGILSQGYHIVNLALKKKPKLFLLNYLYQDRFKAMGYSFGYNFVCNITIGVGLKSSKEEVFLFLGIKSKKVEYRDPKNLFGLWDSRAVFNKSPYIKS